MGCLIAFGVLKMNIVRTDYVRFDWLDEHRNCGVATSVGADGQEIKSELVIGGYTRQGIGVSMHALLIA